MYGCTWEPIPLTSNPVIVVLWHSSVTYGVRIIDDAVFVKARQLCLPLASRVSGEEEE